MFGELKMLIHDNYFLNKIKDTQKEIKNKTKKEYENHMMRIQ